MADNFIPFSIATSPVAWMLGILGLFVWMLFRPNATAPWKILALILLFALEPFSVAVLNAGDRASPLKYDWILQSIDQSLGFTAFQFARLLSAADNRFLFEVYQSLSAAMIVWYGIHVSIRQGQPRKLLYAYLATFLAGPCLYLIVPAIGPRHAFAHLFPMVDPAVTPVTVALKGWSNAMPSLHFATAFLLVLFSGTSRVLRAIAWAYLAGTAAATLAFEHYVIDLVVGVPFACFVAALAHRRVREAAGYLGVVAAWLGSIRFAAPALVHHPTLLRCLVVLTLGLAMKAVLAAPRVGHRETAKSADRVSLPVPER